MGDDDERVTAAAITAGITELQQVVGGLIDFVQRLEGALRTLAEHVDAVGVQTDELATAVDELNARTWDQIAIARRLATLEDHVTRLLGPAGGAPG